MFVSRVAGNIVNEDILGSLEYACKVSGSKLIVVLGHTHCGAIKSAIDDVKMGNITSLLSKIKPAVEKANSSYKGDKSSKNDEFMDAVCHSNIQISIDEIRSKSPILKEMEDLNEIMIVGAIYDMKTGKVDFL
jgi:carbonic anhydrase